MNALEFIEGLAVSNEIGHYGARQAYDAFAEQVGLENAGTYGYFRTKFNNRCKELGVEAVRATTPKPAVTYNPVTSDEPVFEYPTEELPTRKTDNYMEGDEVPLPPDLIPTGTIFDRFICDRITPKTDIEEFLARTGEPMPLEDIEIGGFTRKCADIVAGDPGAGKTTSRALLAVKAKRFARKEQHKELIVHFISGEMRKTEWGKELAKAPLLRELEVTYMLDYVGFPNYMDIFWDAFSYGDIVIVDSLPAILSHFRMSWDQAIHGKMPTETQMIFDFIRKTLKSVEKYDNNIQLINQANKDGSYKGGTELPHMLSSMSYVKRDGEQRYMIFEKNRNNGSCGRKLFFTRDKDGDIEFNEEAYITTYESVEEKGKDLTELMSTLTSANLKERLAEIGEDGSATEMSFAEMQAANGELVIETIPEHLAADIPPAYQRTAEDGQTDLEDNIAVVEFEERERRIREIEQGEGFGKHNGYVGITRIHGHSEGVTDAEYELTLARAIVNGEAEGDIELARQTLIDNGLPVETV